MTPLGGDWLNDVPKLKRGAVGRGALVRPVSRSMRRAMHHRSVGVRIYSEHERQSRPGATLVPVVAERVVDHKGASPRDYTAVLEHLFRTIDALRNGLCDAEIARRASATKVESLESAIEVLEDRLELAARSPGQRQGLEESLSSMSERQFRGVLNACRAEIASRKASRTGF